MIRKIKGKEKINELEAVYGSIKNLKRLFERDDENMLLYSDLEDWEYFMNNPDEELEEGKTIFIKNDSFSNIELELIRIIKKEQPGSISELSRIIDKDVSNLQRKIDKLEKEGLISFERGLKNRKIPIVNYDKIEIPI
jgi:DNA-binding MarR family transcriptional regulator